MNRLLRVILVLVAGSGGRGVVFRIIDLASRSASAVACKPTFYRVDHVRPLAIGQYAEPGCRRIFRLT